MENVLRVVLIFVALILFAFIIMNNSTPNVSGVSNVKECSISQNGKRECYNENESKERKWVNNIIRLSEDEVIIGGTGKDGILSINKPKFDEIAETTFSDDTQVIALEINSEARAYPVSILNWHEIINDTVGGVNILVSYSPLCGTASVFERKVDGKRLEFRSSGLLYNSCSLMYDTETESLWLQPWGVAVSGSYSGAQLKRRVAHLTTLGQWKLYNEKTKVLRPNAEYGIDYNKYPYGNYLTSDILLFPANNQNKLETGVKEVVSIVASDETELLFNEYGGDSAVFQRESLKEEGIVDFEIAGGKATARWDEMLGTIRFFDSTGAEIPSINAFGFSYPALFIGNGGINAIKLEL